MNQLFEFQYQASANKVSRGFKTTDLVLTLALLVIVFSVSGGIVTEAFQETSSNLAVTEAEIIATQIYQKAQTGKVALREPASHNETNEKRSSEISEDPWGRPYHYKTLKSQSGNMKVFVVSAGPNKKLESNLDKFDTGTPVFGGDDIGFVYDGSNKRTE